jgi:hypothetical protein
LKVGRLLLFVVMVILFGLPLAGYLLLWSMLEGQHAKQAQAPAGSWPPPASFSTAIPTVAFEHFNEKWQTYQGEQGIAFRFPPDWQAADTPTINGVILYPPGSDQRYPIGVISLAWIEDTPYQAGVALRSPRPANPGPIISGRPGQWYEDPETAIPAQSLYVETPHRDGTLVISATERPMLNLVPVLVEMLGTIKLD